MEVKFNSILNREEDFVACSLLSIGPINILLDCGCTEQVEESKLKKIAEQAQNINILLITHPDINHIGALPYLHKAGKLKNCTIYATLPVSRLGQMAIYELYVTKKDEEKFTHYGLEDIDAVFKKVVELKFFQRKILNINGEEITLTAFNSGRSLGGSLWKISVRMHEIIYANEINDKTELISQGISFERLEKSNPFLLITDSYYTSKAAKDFSVRMMSLKLHLTETLENGGNVLIPCESSNRIFEVLLKMEDILTTEEKFRKFKIYFLHKMSTYVIDLCKSHIEWMSSAMNQAFFAKENPLSFKFVNVVTDLSEIDFKTNEQKIIFATSPSLDSGFSKTLFYWFAGDPRNKIIMLFKSYKGSNCRTLIEKKPSKLNITLVEKIAKQVFYANTGLQDILSADDAGEDRETAEKINNELEIALKEEAITKQKIDSTIEQERKKNFTKTPFPCFTLNERKGRSEMFGEALKDEEKNALRSSFIDTKVLSVLKPLRERENSLRNLKPQTNKKKIIDDSKKYQLKSTRVAVDVKAKIVYVKGLQGKIDTSSMEIFLEFLNPKNVIILNSSSQKSQKLKDYCFNYVTKEVVVASKEKETRYELGGQHFNVNIDQEFFKEIMLAPIGKEYQIGAFQAVLYRKKEQQPFSSPFMIKLHTSEQAQKKESLEKARDFLQRKDLKITDVQAKLQENGYKTLLVDQKLIFDEKIKISLESGQLKFEGIICEDYYTIRKLVYEIFCYL